MFSAVPRDEGVPPTRVTTPSQKVEVSIVNMYFAAAAYGDRDYGEGHSRLFARAYDHEPTEAEVRGDAFAEANPDWQRRYPGYTLHAASYEWEGTLTDALTIAIIPASPEAAPPTTP